MKVNIKPMAASNHFTPRSRTYPCRRIAAVHLTRCIPIAGLSTGNLAYAPSLEAPGRCYHPIATTDTPTAVGFAICY